MGWKSVWDKSKGTAAPGSKGSSREVRDWYRGGDAEKDIKKNSPLIKAARKATGKDLQKEARRAQKEQRKLIKRQSLVAKRERAEAESEVNLRKARTMGRQYGRRSLLGG